MIDFAVIFSGLAIGYTTIILISGYLRRGEN